MNDQIEIQEENVVESQKTLYVALIVDESSSMGSMSTQAISLFNENLETMKIESKKHNIRNLLSLIKFSSDVKIVFQNLELDKVEKVNNKTYFPSGMTAMYDGIGTGINVLKSVSDYNDENVSFLVLIITDGEENSSKEFDGKKLSELINELEETKRWTFTVLGANIDLKKLSKNLGIKMGNMQDFSFDTDGFLSGSQHMTRGIQNLYSAKCHDSKLSVKNFYGKEES